MKVRVLKKQHNSNDCAVCGVKNPISLNAQIYELENGMVVGLTTGRECHQSYPNRMHGGIISALLDEIIGRAITILEPETFGVTASLEVKFKKPVPLNEPIKVVGKIIKNTRMFFETEGFVEDQNGNILAIAHATYVKQNVEKISNTTFTNENWFVIKDNVEFVDIKNTDFFETRHFLK